jgi:hypothetical protein
MHVITTFYSACQLNSLLGSSRACVARTHPPASVPGCCCGKRLGRECPLQGNYLNGCPHCCHAPAQLRASFCAPLPAGLPSARFVAAVPAAAAAVLAAAGAPAASVAGCCPHPIFGPCTLTTMRCNTRARQMQIVQSQVVGGAEQSGYHAHADGGGGWFWPATDHPDAQLLPGQWTPGQRLASRSHLCLLRSRSLLLLLLLLLSLLDRRLSRSLSLSLSRSLRSLCSLLRLLSCLSLPSYRSRSRLRSRSCRAAGDSRAAGSNQVGGQYD